MKGDDLNCLSWNAASRGILPSLVSKAATNKVCPPLMLYNILGNTALQNIAVQNNNALQYLVQQCFTN